MKRERIVSLGNRISVSLDFMTLQIPLRALAERHRVIVYGNNSAPSLELEMMPRLGGVNLARVTAMYTKSHQRGRIVDVNRVANAALASLSLNRLHNENGSEMTVPAKNRRSPDCLFADHRHHGRTRVGPVNIFPTKRMTWDLLNDLGHAMRIDGCRGDG